MPFSLHLTAGAKATLEQLQHDTGLAKRLNAVRKTLAGQITIIAITPHP